MITYQLRKKVEQGDDKILAQTSNLERIRENAQRQELKNPYYIAEVEILNKKITVLKELALKN